MLASNFKLPLKNIVISLGPTSAKQEFLSTGAAKQLQVVVTTGLGRCVGLSNGWLLGIITQMLHGMGIFTYTFPHVHVAMFDLFI